MKRPSDQAKLLFLGLLKTVSALAVEPRGAGSAVAAASSVAAAATASTATWHEQLGAARRHLPPQRRPPPHSTHHHLLHPSQQQQPSQVQAAASAVATASATTTTWSQQQQDDAATNILPPLTLRLARRTDVPSIQRCNLATLPENYNAQFYVQHMRTWPDLALVVVEDDVNENERRQRNRGGGGGGFPFGAYQPQQPEQTVVAYVLGKVEERREPVLPSEDDILDDDCVDSWLSSATATTRYQTVQYGHVTSLAVAHDYRRQGLARQLMEQLHYQLQHYRRSPAAPSGQVQHVGLHVRQSNLAACRLYEQFGYRQAERIPTYYQDGEDAYYMLKSLQEQDNEKENVVQRQARQQRQAPPPRQPPRRRPFPTQAASGLFAAWGQPQQRPHAAAAAAASTACQQQQQQQEQQQQDLTLPRNVGPPPPSLPAEEPHEQQQLLMGTY